ncbi:MAG: hypothetical protein IJO87_07050 [Eggerthellaceae bacterium]|nr:hypothetical protein [Eggerthellaceae bacterium]
MDDKKSRTALMHCEALGELAFDVFTNSQYAYYMTALEAQGSGVAFGELAVHTRFSMSYAAYQSMKLYYFTNRTEISSAIIDEFLGAYGTFSRFFSGGLITSIGIDIIAERFSDFEAAFGRLQELLSATRERYGTHRGTMVN